MFQHQRFQNPDLANEVRLIVMDKPNQSLVEMLRAPEFDRVATLECLELILCDRKRFFRHVETLDSAPDLPETVPLSREDLDTVVRVGLVAIAKDKLTSIALCKDHLEYLFGNIERDIFAFGGKSVWHSTYRVVYDEILAR